MTAVEQITRPAALAPARCFLLLLCAVLAMVAACPTFAAQGKDQRKKGKSKQQDFALLAGTVFDQNGRRVPGADIRVREKNGKRHWESVTDSEGEFAVRLPPGAAVYTVAASRRGFSADTKEVTFSQDERLDVSLTVTRSGAQEP